VPADGNLMMKKGKKFMFGTGVMDGLSSLTIILMAVAGAGYALYISGESLVKKAAKADKSPRLANLLKMIGGSLMLVAIGLFVLRWLFNRF